MLKKLAVAFAVVMCTVAGCVIRTEHKIEAHITLDVRHVSEQAASILDYVEGKTDQLPPLEAKPTAPKPSGRVLENAWDALFPAAYADGVKVTQSPLVLEILERMRGRNTQIKMYKQQGCLGENNRGYLEWRDCDAGKDPDEKNRVQQLLAEENKDRKVLYREIARLNEADGLTITQVELIYALQRINRAEKGEIVQLPPAGSAFEEFKNTDLVKRLGDRAVPEAWVVVP